MLSITMSARKEDKRSADGHKRTAGLCSEEEMKGVQQNHLSNAFAAAFHFLFSLKQDVRTRPEYQLSRDWLMPGSLLRGSLYQQEETRELCFHRGALRLQQLIQTRFRAQVWF